MDPDSQVSHSSSHTSGKVTREGVGLDPSDQAVGRQQGTGGDSLLRRVRVHAGSLGTRVDGHAVCVHACIRVSMGASRDIVEREGDRRAPGRKDHVVK